MRFFGFEFFALLTLSLMLPNFAHARVLRQEFDAKWPTQMAVEKQIITNPPAANSTLILSGVAGVTATSDVTVTSFAAQPTVTRNLVLTPGGTTADVTACTVTVTGTDFYGKVITEGFAVTNTQSTATTGVKAFKTVTSVIFPAACESGATHAATWSLGTGTKLGLKYCMDSADHYLHTGFGGVKETTAATIAANATAVSGNTASLNSSLTGSSSVSLFFFQNFRCKP